MDTLVKQAHRVGPYLSFNLYLTLYKTDITFRWTLMPFSKVSVLDRTYCIAKHASEAPIFVSNY